MTIQPQERVVLVTAAGRGIGAGAAEILVAKGWRAVLFARSEEVEATGKRLGALTVRGDVTNPDDLKRLCDAALEAYGRVDGVVLSTGHPAKGNLLELSAAEWHRGLDLTLLPLLTLSRLLLPVFQAQGGGSVVTISSSAAIEPSVDFPISSPLRAAVSNLTKLLAREYARDGIRFNSVLPGFVDNREPLERRLDKIPMGRYGSPAELGQLIAFLLSSDASYVTGQNILADGGMVASV